MRFPASTQDDTVLYQTAQYEFKTRQVNKRARLEQQYKSKDRTGHLPSVTLRKTRESCLNDKHHLSKLPIYPLQTNQFSLQPKF